MHHLSRRRFLANWMIRIMLLGMLLASLTCAVSGCGSPPNPGNQREHVPRLGKDFVTGIRIFQGRDLVVYCTPRRMCAISVDSAGQFIKHQVQIAEPVFFGFLCFPVSCASESGGGVPIRAWLLDFDCPWVLGGFSGLELYDREWLWWFDPDSLNCRRLLKWGLPFGSYDSFNTLGGHFPAVWYDQTEKPGEIDKTDKLIVVSSRDGSWRTMPNDRTPLNACFLLENADPIFSDADKGATGPEGTHLFQGNKQLAAKVLKVLGATWDVGHVFFTRIEDREGESKQTFWAYNVKRKVAHKLMNWVGDEFRVGKGCDKIGFLEAIDSPGRPVAFVSEKLISGARIFDLSGKLLRHYTFQEDIRCRVYDWDPQWEIIAYYDEADEHLVIRSLDGRIVAKFRP